MDFNSQSFINANHSFREAAFTNNGFHRQDQISFSSSTTSSINESTAQDVQRYLCRDEFPIGSLDNKARTDVITNIMRLTSEQSLKLAVELLDRLAQEVEFYETSRWTQTNSENRKQQQQQVGGKFALDSVLKIPKSIVHDVVRTWSTCWKQQSTDISPRTVFEKLVTWEARKNTKPIPHRMIMQAATTSQDPDLAEEVLGHLIDANSNGNCPCPDIMSFQTVIMGWVKSGRHDAAARAESVLRKMLELKDSGQLNAPLDTISFNMVMSAWANISNEHAIQRAEELLREMERRLLVPDRRSYTTLITSWSRSKQDDAGDPAHAILKHMISLYEQGVTEAKPDMRCFSAVMSAYASRGDLGRAEQVLTELCQRFLLTGDRDLLPDSSYFNMIIHGWAKSDRPEASKMAEAMLQRMQDFAEASNEPLLKPQRKSFSSVLHAWAKSKDNNAPLRCEAILQRMQYLHENGLVDCQPDVVSFNTVLNCWAKSSRSEAPERAEAILRHLIHLNEIGHLNTRPDNLTYSSVINAWSRSGRPDAGERAQALFDELIQKHKAGDQDLKPNRQTFGMLITAWSRSNRKGSALKAQAAFDEMMGYFTPEAEQFGALIDGWTKAGEPEIAEKILRNMESDASIAVKPHIGCYTSVMRAWSRSGRPDRAERVQALFDELDQKHKAGDQGLIPNRHTFGVLITAWGRSGRKDSALKAQAAFDDMMCRYSNGDKEAKPDVTHFGALIDSWAKAGNPEMAEQILRNMESNALLAVKPDVACYNTVIQGWTLVRRPDALKRAHLLLKEMTPTYQAGAQRLQPNFFTFDTLIRASLESGTPTGLLMAETLFGELQAGHGAGGQASQVAKLGAMINAAVRIQPK